ncbi:MAG: helix-turn-helix transcriptional regulator [Erysipelotrichaceae bacterium]|nr:helix-turn-helix transcriptional regulator [Erysipelotrichaceae bacterium]
MNQIKIGDFLRKLRHEKELTQIQLADILFVSNKSISRWEKGKGLPDIDILIELARFYGVSLEELLVGQGNEMTDNVESTVLKVAELENEEKKKMKKITQILVLFSMVLMIISYILSNYLNQNDIIDFIYGFCNGVTFATLALILIVTGRWGLKIREFKDGSLTAIFINELHFSA